MAGFRSEVGVVYKEEAQIAGGAARQDCAYLLGFSYENTPS